MQTGNLNCKKHITDRTNSRDSVSAWLKRFINLQCCNFLENESPKYLKETTSNQFKSNGGKVLHYHKTEFCIFLCFIKAFDQWLSLVDVLNKRKYYLYILLEISYMNHFYYYYQFVWNFG